MIKLDHLALYVTDLKRSMDFFTKILHAQVYGPVSPGNLTYSGRFAEKFNLGDRKITKSMFNQLSPELMRNLRINIALVASNGSDYDILLVEQRDTNKNYIRSVDGKTVYGFSYTLSPKVDMEIQAWDLESLGVSFRHGDPELDGSVYTQECSNHSIYIKDPDDRIIELKQGTDINLGKNFIQSLDSVTLHVTYPEISKKFYQDNLYLLVEDIKSDNKNKSFTWLSNENKEKIILLYGLTGLDGLPIKAGGYGLEHIALKGLSVRGIPCNEVTDVKMKPEELNQKAHSQYICDKDGYWIENYK
jgi:hypothetical protein